MPGRNLNDKERALLDFWREPSANFPQPLLKGLVIEGPAPLRGVENLSVPFAYPITAIAGINGAGKSTVLALLAFSARRDQNWRVSPWPTSPNRRQTRRMTYHWNDFFFRRHGDLSYDGLRVRFICTWKGNDVEFLRERMNGYWRSALTDLGRSHPLPFPSRPIEFVSLARILPPGELHHVRSQFGTERSSNAAIRRLSADMCGIMSLVFGKPYTRIEVHELSGSVLTQCTAGFDYNGFDMGSGESAVVNILSILDRMPPGGLLIIEEIEHGLHPEAQFRLIEALTLVVEEKKQQIVFTTHSAHIIDRLPREGRILLERMPGGHRAVPRPTTRMALAGILGEAQPEATIFAEDNFAADIVSAAIGSLLERIRVIPVNRDGAGIVRQLSAHIRGGVPGPAACVFDGDCSDVNIERWRRSEDVDAQNLIYTKLPGEGMPPEKWVLAAVSKEPHLTGFANAVGLDAADAAGEIQRLNDLPDHHNVSRELARRRGMSKNNAQAALISAVARSHHDLENIRHLAADLLS